MRVKIAQLKQVAQEAGLKTILLMILTLLLLVGYILQVNKASTAGYAMRDLDRSIEHLQLENQRLNMQVARLQSVDSVTTRIQMLGLRPVSNVKFVHVSEPTVALR